MKTALALDGPLNGQYITQDQAEDNGYSGLHQWTADNKELVYDHRVFAENMDETGVPLELVA